MKHVKQFNYKVRTLQFQEIVDSIPDELVAFFERFESSRNQLTLT